MQAIPLHASSTILPPDYFSPGTTVMNGREIGSPWVIAYWNGQSYRFEREGLGKEWVLREIIQGRA